MGEGKRRVRLLGESSEVRTGRILLMAQRYYFDVVCPYSYIMGFEVEAAEDGVLEVEWVPFELRLAPASLPDPRGKYIRDYWRGQVYRLALEHDVEIHVPRYQPSLTLALTLHSFAVEEGTGRAYRGAAHRASFVEGVDVSDESVLRETA
jgi:predicted DsbA family dithiol-disulfide isomerase